MEVIRRRTHNTLHRCRTRLSAKWPAAVDDLAYLSFMGTQF